MIYLNEKKMGTLTGIHRELQLIENVFLNFILFFQVKVEVY